MERGELLPRLSTLTATGRAKAQSKNGKPVLSGHGGISLLHSPWGYPRRPLAVILSCEARTFLTMHIHYKNCIAQPSGLPAGLMIAYIGEKIKDLQPLKKILVFLREMEYNNLDRRTFKCANGRVLCDRMPRTMSGGEPSSIKWIFLCAAVNLFVCTFKGTPVIVFKLMNLYVF